MVRVAQPSPQLADEAVRYLQDLLRIDTTNPPGNETEAAQYLAAVLRDEGYDPEIVESSPGRGSVVVRYRGTGELAPLLLYGHVDVVTADAARWTRGPFSGDLENGQVWGRGALDMKGMVAQELMIMLLLRRNGVRLRRDVIFAATADEEGGGQAGLGYLVARHPELIRAEFGLSEGAGTTMHVAGRAFYDIRTGEKGTCRFKLRAAGQTGHASVPRAETSIGKIAKGVVKLSSTSLPFRSTDTVSGFFSAIANALGVSSEAGRLTSQNLDAILRMLPAEFGNYLRAITHDTAVVTMLRAGEKINVIPAEAEAWIDGRYLPGQTPQGFLREVRDVIGEGYEIEPVDISPPLEDPPGGPLYDTILASVRAYAPHATVIPSLMSGATDAKHLVRLGTRCLGFGPVQVPENFPAEHLIHGHDERIPVDGYVWGLHVLYDIVTGFCA